MSQLPQASDWPSAANGAVAIPIEPVIKAFELLGSVKTIDAIRDEVQPLVSTSTKIVDAYPCTPLQEGLMALSMKHKQQFVPQTIYKLPAMVNFEKFRDAWQTTADSNAILRTRIVQTSTFGLIQVVLDKQPITWILGDNLQEYLARDKQAPTGFGSVLFRYGFVDERSSGNMYFVWSVHHAVMDGWSTRLLLNQVDQIYQQAKRSQLAEFNQFIFYLTKLDPNVAETFWREQLADFAAVQFPSLLSATYIPRANSSFVRHIQISQKLASAATNSTVIQASWALLLGRITTTNDVVFGQVLAGRNVPVPNIKSINGPTFTTVPMRVVIDMRLSARDFLAVVRKQKSGTKPHQHAGLQSIRRLGINGSTACKFQNLLVIQPTVDEYQESLFNSRSDSIDRTTKLNVYGLMLICNLTDDGFMAMVNFDSNMISEQQVDQALKNLEHIIEQLASKIDQPLSDIDHFDFPRKSDAPAQNPEPKVIQSCLHEVIEKCSYQCPTAPAVCSWNGNLTHEQLNVLSMKLAVHLRSLAIGPEVRVALLFEKSLWTLVAMMAVMKSGGVFVPLDPTHPKERVAGIIQNVGAQLLLCSEKYYEAFSDILAEKLIVSAESLANLTVSNSPVQSTVTPRNAIYIMYTSGSTGKPKGCVIEHAACCVTLQQLTKVFGINSKSRVLQFSSYTFDGCILEMLATLTVGGCVCIPSDEDRLNNLAATINNMNINFLFLTPVVSRLITPQSVPNLETLVLGGEKLAQQDFDRWVGRLRLFQAYGPTECCVMCVVNEITDRSTKGSHIGVSVVGTSLVVDDANNLVSPGTVGELLIGGPNLARGYFNDHEKTAAAFVESSTWPSHSNRDCTRFYKTGDLVKIELDGTIDYVGRKDAQVKLRGQRIEMGEIEHHVRQNLDGVLDVAVELIHPTENIQNPLLAAFVSLEDCLGPFDDSKITSEFIANHSSLHTRTAELSNRLSAVLPLYMLPSIFIPMRKLPLTTSGKTDRRKLQRIVSDLTLKELAGFYGQSQGKIAPMTTNENMILQLVLKVLNVPQDMIGINDNFLHLGGDSILAMKLVAAARSEGLLLTVADIFENPRLSDLASIVTAIDRRAHCDATGVGPFALIRQSVHIESITQDAIAQCGLSAESIEDMYPCTPFQEGVMALSTRRPGAYMAQHVFELSTGLNLNLTDFYAAWEAVVKQNPILRTRIVQTGSAGLMQLVAKDEISWLFRNDLDGYLRQDREIPMDFGTPLCRYAIIMPMSAQRDKSFFVWTTHHAIYDGYSLQLTLKAVNQAYQELKSAEPRNKNPINHLIPFNIFIKCLMSLDVSKAERFWSMQFCDGQPSTYPFIQPRYLSRLTESSKSKIQYVRKPNSDITSSTIVRAAWAILIGKYANSNDVVFGAVLSGRTDSSTHLDRVMGPTVTTVPIRVLIDPMQSVADFLRFVQKQNLDMAPFAHLGISNIRRVNVTMKSVCDFQNLLVIQPTEDLDKGESVLGCRQRNLMDTRYFDTYPLTLECQLNLDELIVTSIFDAAILDRRQIERMIFQFQHILQQLCLEQDNSQIQDIETISPQDVQELWRWNGSVPQILESCVHHLIEKVMLEDPSAPAICSHDGNLTYSDLSSLSSRLANYLIEQGVEVESKVPILFEKSKWAVVAMLGIIKAGGAFVPLDPSHPEQRLRSICHQVDAKVLVSSTNNAHLCPVLLPNGISVIMDSSEVVQLMKNDKALSVDVRPSNALYLIFTSGTTGSPKGTVLEHGAYCSSARDHAKALFINRSSRFLQFASYSFDTGIEDILTTLLVGGCICIPSEDERRCDVVGAMKRMNVTLADLTPSFVSHIAPRDVKSLKTLIMGGEPLTQKIINTWANRLRLINAYGTTECCVTNLVNSEVTLETAPMNIGKAVGCVTWIVDEMNHDRLAPIGTIGELLIEGPALARGYLNDEVKTSAAFVESPAWAHKSNDSCRPRRLYKTGDLVQYNADGTVNYLGRKDSRVKIRGQRVELEEIEHHLNSHPQVATAIAMIPQSGLYRDCLTAVVHFGSITDPLTHRNIKIVERSRMEAQGIHWSDISNYLSGRIPSYMVPLTWIAIETMPMLASGKLDRPRLTLWLANLSEEEIKLGGWKDNGPLPLSDDESIAIEISNMIADCISGGHQSIRANVAGNNVRLSDCGMDSIRITSLAAFIKKSYGVVLGIQQLMGNGTTIRDISKQILEAKAGSDNKLIPPINFMDEFASLSAQLNAAVRSDQAQLETIFMTGATGYFGTQLLRQLLLRPNVQKIIVHVRAHSLEHGRQRIISTATTAKWWCDEYLLKLEIWVGDLGQPRIGLSLQQWKDLSKVDIIIHNGASVHWNLDYHALKAVNVISTLELLMLAGGSCAQTKFVYVSGGRHFGDEADDSTIAAKLAPLEGYSQSKFVAELLVKHFAQQRTKTGQHVSIIKPGLIIGTTNEGIANIDDFIWRLAAGAVSIKSYPEPDAGDWLYVSSAERIARVLIDSLLKPPNEGLSIINNISDGVAMYEFWNILNAKFNHDLRPIPFREWVEMLREDVETQKDAHPVWPVFHVLEREGKIGSKQPSEEIPAKDSEAVKIAIGKNIDFLIEIGFLTSSDEKCTAGNSKGGKYEMAFKRRGLIDTYV